jgi:hypothetical protein
MDYWELIRQGQIYRTPGGQIDVVGVTRIIVSATSGNIATAHAEIIVENSGDLTTINIVTFSADGTWDENKSRKENETNRTLSRYTYNKGNNMAVSFGLYVALGDAIFYDMIMWRLVDTTEVFNPNIFKFSLGFAIAVSPYVAAYLSFVYTTPFTQNWAKAIPAAYGIINLLFGLANQYGVVLSSQGIYVPYNPTSLGTPEY